MYDADYESYKQELLEEAALVKKFVTKDSGSRAQHPDGVVRDTEVGKPRFDLIWPEGIDYADQLLTRVAWLYERGAAKYGDRNWEKSETEETLAHHRAAFLRHVFKFYAGVDDGEDHAAAVVWNVNAMDLTRRNIKAKAEALGKMAEYLEETQEALKEETGPAGIPWTPDMKMPDIMGSDAIVTPAEVIVKANGALDPVWEEGDTLREMNASLGAGRYNWLYSSKYTDTWTYQQFANEAYNDDSARSFKMLRQQFAPLRVVSGKYTGLVINKENFTYEPE